MSTARIPDGIPDGPPRPKLLDLFCGAGGAAMGYHRAGFDVVGVDIAPQPRYPFEFHLGDAMTWPLEGFDAIHASPPCTDHSTIGPQASGTGWMLAETRKRLEEQPRAWVIENVPGAPMRADFRLCGCMFGLPRLKRDRWFETSWRGFDLRSPCFHPGRVITVCTKGGGGGGGGKPLYTAEERRQAMGVDWMDNNEIGLAIPPAYTEYIGGQLMEVLGWLKV